LEILDLACNELEEISGLEAQADCLEELWVNNNLVSNWKDIENLGVTMKKLDNFYIACNPIHERGEEFKVKMKATVPSLTQLEGSPFDRPTYYFAQPHGVNSIVKKGINPKAKAILEDILGKTAADEYEKDRKAQEEEVK
jgi:hypothetical protein